MRREIKQRQKKKKKKTGDNAMLKNCDIITIFLIYNQSGAIRGSGSGCIVCKTYIFIFINHVILINL